MRPRTDSESYLDHTLAAFVVAAFVLAFPFCLVWTAPGTPWLVPYLIWLGVIVLVAAVQRWRGPA